MNKLNERLTLIANLSVVVGIIFLVVELQQNTEAIRSQTRASITNQQMTLYGWFASNRDLAEVDLVAESGLAGLDPVDSHRFTLFTQAAFREWENAHYQNELGLFTTEEYEAWFARWQAILGYHAGLREAWLETRDGFSLPPRREVIASNVALPLSLELVAVLANHRHAPYNNSENRKFEFSDLEIGPREVR